MNLFMKTGIAGAVAREIRRGLSEGVAYKAEWDRRGGNALKLCNDQGRDCAVMEWCMSRPGAALLDAQLQGRAGRVAK